MLCYSMKKIILLASLLSFPALAQQRIHSSIHDDGKKLSIDIQGKVDGKAVEFQHTYEVSNLSKAERDRLVADAYRSIGLDAPEAPVPPTPPSPPSSPSAPPPTPPSPPNSPNYKIPTNASLTVDEDDKHMTVKVERMENGKRKTVQKSMNTEGKSESEKRKMVNQVIKEFEQSH